MLCKDECPKEAIHIVDHIEAYNAVIDQNACINCGNCFSICQVNNPIQVVKPLLWQQGWAEDEKIRSAGASGGVATAIEKSFIRRGGTVYSCVQQKECFVFKAVEKENEISIFSGSKYVKSNPQGIYREIKQLLQEKQQVLLVEIL